MANLPYTHYLFLKPILNYTTFIKKNAMNFNTRKWVKPEDLNANHTLFGGRLLSWIDEEAAMYSIIQLENKKVVTKYMSEINFMSTAQQGDIVEIGIAVIKFGKTSLVLKCEARNKMTMETILTVDNIIMVNLDPQGKPLPHGKTKVEYVEDRLADND
jgi:acyl-CoA hydrolase